MKNEENDMTLKEKRERAGAGEEKGVSVPSVREPGVGSACCLLRGFWADVSESQVKNDIQERKTEVGNWGRS